jgi:hypothetical protein
MKGLMKVGGIIVILMIIGLVCGCPVDPSDQVMITINDIGDEFDDYYATVALTDPKDPATPVAAAKPKKISKGKVSELEMLDAADPNKLFGKKGNYHLLLIITNDYDMTQSPPQYFGQSGQKSIVKGSQSFNADIFSPPVSDSKPAPQPPANNFGTYTAPVNYDDAGNSKAFVETVELGVDRFYIKDNTNGVGVTPDDINFRIDSWEEVSPPAAQAQTYPKAYKFSGKIISAYTNTGGTGVAAGGYIPSTKTAPGFTMSDVNVNGNGPTCVMYIYFNGSTGNITFVRTAFTKTLTGAAPAVVTGDDGQPRVYSKTGN